MARRPFVKAILVSVAVLATTLFSFPSAAQNLEPGAKHPVAQLIEWELTANSALSRDALERMASVILVRAQVSDIPKDVMTTLDLGSFRNNPDSRRKSLGALSEEQLKRLVVLPAPMEYFEVPEENIKKLNHIQHEIEMDGFSEARALLKFEKNGQAYVRWPVHPLTEYKTNQFRAIYERSFGVKLEAKTGFLNFHFTSSRSTIIFSDSYDTATSIKLSLPQSEGPFKNKAIHLKEFTAWARHNSYIANALGTKSLPDMNLQYEPLGIGVRDGSGEDALLVRNITELKRGRYLIPVFAILHSDIGEQIARLNGNSDTLGFWEKHLIEGLARGMAQLRATTGAEHTSPHSQNLLVELDEKFRPTGKVVLRDFDFYVDKPVFEVLNNIDFNSSGVVKDSVQPHLFSLRNGLYQLPTWLTEADMGRWIKKYFQEFRVSYSSVLRIEPQTAFPSTDIYKYDGWFQVVKNDNFLTGGKNSFHHIQISNESSFKELLTSRLVAQKARPQPYVKITYFHNNVEPFKYTPPVTAPPSEQYNSLNKETQSAIAPIKTWRELLSVLKEISNIDQLNGRLGILVNQKTALTFDERKALVEHLISWKFRSHCQAGQSASTLIAVMRVISFVEPVILRATNFPFETWLSSRGGNALHARLANRLLNDVSELQEINRKLREGSKMDSLLASQKVRANYPAFQSIADSLAFRIKRTEDAELKRDLAMTLASIGKGSEVIRTFFKNNLTGPADRKLLDEVTGVLDGNEAPAQRSLPRRCVDIFKAS